MTYFSLPWEGGLIEKNLPEDILHSFDRIYTDVYENAFEASSVICEEIVAEINAWEKENPGKLFKLGLTTGRTPLTLYSELKKACNDGKVSFRNVEVFSIDEYYPVSSQARQSRNARLHSELLDAVDILRENIHIPDGEIEQERLTEYCSKFDKEAHGMNLLVIGFGLKGQIAFNEQGSSFSSRTRAVILPYASRKVQARNFNGDIANTPSMAITAGISTLMSAKKVILMGWGEDKAETVRTIVETPASVDCPASCFQTHENARMIIDRNAAANLTRNVAPWLIGSCEWTGKLRRKAVVWLCQKLGKPILKLSAQDYLMNGLGELLDQYESYDKLNIEIFNDLQHTISGWPGGKPGADDSTRPVPSNPYPKKVLIFSPHPDDDIISMGGTFIRLAHQGHDVHVAYETSGNVAVHDDVVLQHMDAAFQLGFGDRFDKVKELVQSKKPGEPEPRALLDIKAAIRRSEARGACRSFGLNDNTNVHFLNLPFYESGGIKKLPRSQADVDIVKKLMNELEPHMIFMAGDLADPHGTHRVCTEVALEALRQIKEEGALWAKTCNVWMYRGAWMEWEIGRVDMAVPLSPEEVVEKRHAIYHHLSQKDIVPFPGDDPREFWQRAEDRTQNTARIYDELGMAEYQAIEVFLKLY